MLRSSETFLVVDMPKGNNFSEINPAETVTLTFDFGPMLTAGVTISVPQASCSVISGTDLNPSSRLDGAPSITSSPSDKGANRAVLQQVTTMQAAVRYLLTMLVSTSDNQTLQLYAYAPCAAPG
jgi:hypothetical protein